MRTLLTTTLTALVTFATAHAQTTVTLSAEQDNTIWDVDAACCSSGNGTFGFVGTNGLHQPMRFLIRFDVAGAIPAGAVITDATLHVQCLQTNAGPNPTDVHRLLESWGEGDSTPGGGQGAMSSGEDANWIVRNLALGQNWTTPGGEFVGTASGTTSIDGPGGYAFSAGTMAADVQTWLDSPSSNHGWILIGDEPAAGSNTGKRLAAREFGRLGPRLEVTFTFSGAFAAPFGPSCDDASDAPPSLALAPNIGTGRPSIGQPMRLQFSAGTTPTTGTALLLATGQLTPWVDLPSPLTCSLHVDPIVWSGATDASDGMTLTVPTNPSLTGTHLYWQVFGIAQPFRLVSTNGLLTQLGF